ncbi:hypothetical protein C8R47DRAFT_243054 [Mycena vitilis]|nr:hypothetical protein C8R47DRAFT_243054 [Mycena vitilis]
MCISLSRTPIGRRHRSSFLVPFLSLLGSRGACVHFSFPFIIFFLFALAPHITYCLFFALAALAGTLSLTYSPCPYSYFYDSNILSTIHLLPSLHALYSFLFFLKHVHSFYHFLSLAPSHTHARTPLLPFRSFDSRIFLDVDIRSGVISFLGSR